MVVFVYLGGGWKGIAIAVTFWLLGHLLDGSNPFTWVTPSDLNHPDHHWHDYGADEWSHRFYSASDERQDRWEQRREQRRQERRQERRREERREERQRREQEARDREYHGPGYFISVTLPIVAMCLWSFFCLAWPRRVGGWLDGWADYWQWGWNHQWQDADAERKKAAAAEVEKLSKEVFVGRTELRAWGASQLKDELRRLQRLSEVQMNFSGGSETRDLHRFLKGGGAVEKSELVNAVLRARGGDSGTSCSICLVDYEHGAQLRVLPCGHRFHCECVDHWLTKQSRTCPLCSKAI
eukprot:TRINITY_DN32675_c0_g1_i3.p1 TRINITY_DN32675_c0_g1~~TRINITY_DN32675_c0_g1_i3.p1  ORF type:complete len:296 (+),score=61.54 TRINITY_DN32675_c0_g1_i3:111-998(+)